MSYPDSHTTSPFPQDVSPHPPCSSPEALHNARFHHQQDLVIIADATAAASKERLQSELQDVYAALNRKAREVDELREELRGKHDELERERERRNLEVESGGAATNAASEQAVAELQTSLASMTEERDTIHADYETLQLVHALALTRVDSLSIDVELTLLDRQNVQQELFAATSRIQDLVVQHENSLLQHAETMNGLNADIGTLREEKGRAEEQVEVQSRINETLRGKLNPSVVEMRGMKGRLLKAEEELDAATVTARTAKQDLARSSDAYAQLESSTARRIAEVDAQLKRITDEKTAAEDRLMAEMGVSHVLRERLDRSASLLQQGRADREALAKEKGKIARELQDVRKSNQELSVANDYLVSQITGSKEREAELQDAMARLKKLQTTTEERLAAEISVSQTLRADLDRTVAERQEAQVQLDAARADLQKVTNELQTAEESRRCLEQSCTRLSADAIAAAQREAALRSDFAQLAEENAAATERLNAEVSVSKALRVDLEQATVEQNIAWTLLQQTRAELETAAAERGEAVEAETKLKSRFPGLERRIKAAEKRAGASKKEAEELHRAKVDMEAQLRAQIEAYKTLHKDHERSLTQSEVVRAQLAVTETGLRGAKQEVLEAKEAGLRSLLQAEVAIVQLATAEANLESARQALVGANEVEQALRFNISTLEAASKWTLDQLASLRDEKAAQERQIAEHVAEVQRMKTDLQEKEALLRGTRTEVERLRGVMATMRKSSGDSKELQAKVKALTRELQQAQASMSVKQEENPSPSAVDIENELSRLRMQLAAALEDARSWRSDARSLQDWLATEISRNEELRKDVVARGTDLEAVKTELTAVKTELTAMQTELETMREERTDLLVKIAGMESGRGAGV